MNPDSILDSTKRILGLASDYDVFDLDVITHINSAFSTLHQLGVGPTDGFMISDDTAEWDAFLTAGDYQLLQVKSYVFLRVRMIFDPPPTSFAIAAVEKQIKEIEWRLMAHMAPPVPTTITEDEDPFMDSALIFDGGPP